MEHSNSTFSLQRFQFLINRYIALYWRRASIAYGAVAGLIIIINTMLFLFEDPAAGEANFSNLLGICLFLYMLGGLVFASAIFKEIHKPETGIQYFILPASTLEKFTAAWITTSLLYTLFSIAGIFILGIIIEFMGAYFTGSWSSFEFFNPLNQEVLKSAANFFFYQSFFLMGSVYFKSYHFMKTFFSIILLVISLMMLGMLFLFEFVHETSSTAIDLSSLNLGYVTYGIGFVIMASILGAAYYVFKNREVTA